MEFAKNNFTKHLPDVHILIFDSTSLSSMYRTMPKTVDYIREKYVATPFKYLNKVGINSRPNGYAFLLGRFLRHPLEYCIDSVDNDTFIGFEFRDLGYKTLMSEDWALEKMKWS
uniref:Hexosyltransferase n=2 Tax=Acrobeloides nanus TaxID=290746 RepID=A0A914DX89_9BILA